MVSQVFLFKKNPLDVADKIKYLEENDIELSKMKKFNHDLVKKEYSTERMVNEVESLYLKMY